MLLGVISADLSCIRFFVIETSNALRNAGGTPANSNVRSVETVGTTGELGIWIFLRVIKSLEQIRPRKFCELKIRMSFDVSLQERQPNNLIWF